MTININGVIVSNDDKWIYDHFGIEAVCPKEISEALSNLSDKNESVIVKINSDGGDMFAASEIYEELRAYKGNLTIKVVGLAASGASVIACAGYSEIAPTAMLMIHNVSSYAEGDFHDMEESSEVLQKANKAIANSYCEKTGKPIEEILKLMDKESWITADEAVSMGFIDKITEPQSSTKLAASYRSGLLPQSVIKEMQNKKANSKVEAQLNLLKLI